MQALLRTCKSLFVQNPVAVIQSRNVMADWRMWKDYKRRKAIKEYAFEKLQLKAMLRSPVLPDVVRKQAREEINKLPRDAHHTRCHQRCVITSHSRSVIMKYRLGRHAWRHLADYNKLSGVQKAMW